MGCLPSGCNAITANNKLGVVLCVALAPRLHTHNHNIKKYQSTVPVLMAPLGAAITGRAALVMRAQYRKVFQ